MKVTDAVIDEWFPGYLQVFDRKTVDALVESCSKMVNTSKQVVDPKKRKN